MLVREEGASEQDVTFWVAKRDLSEGHIRQVSGFLERG